LHLKASEALSLQAEAEEKVRKDEKVKFAKSLFTTSLINEEIAKHTGLTVEQIEQLRNEK
jgi:CRISPR/Cas system type I-B associated protein Csh2 (Cas7 group RAMP superfamily)